VILRAHTSLRPSVGTILGTYLEFYFTDRKDGWELRGRRVEINFNETRGTRGKFFSFSETERTSKEKPVSTSLCVREKLTPSLFRSCKDIGEFYCWSEGGFASNEAGNTKETLPPTHLFNLQRYCTSCNFTEDCNRSLRFCIFNRQCCSKMPE